MPISDAHIGAKGFTKTMTVLQGYVDWVKARDNARVTLIGDILNTATRTTKGSPLEQELDLREQINYATKLFEPIKDKIIGVSEGWHETQIEDHCGYSPTIALCDRLGLQFLGYSGVIVLGVGVDNRGDEREAPNVSYVIYQHHTTGGGATPGGKINRVDKLRSLCANADVYLGGHNHALGVMTIETYIADTRLGEVNLLRQHLVDCGGYLSWDESYAERAMLPPVKIGSPRIRFDGKSRRKDVHVSI